MNTQKTIWIAITFGLIAMISRVLPHPPNFTAMGALVLMGGALTKRFGLFLLAGIATWFVSDLLINNVVYASYQSQFVWIAPYLLHSVIALCLIGTLSFFLLKRLSLPRFLVGGALSSIVFYLVSNFGVWYSTPMYAANGGGLLSSYINGLPYLAYDFAGMLCYSAVFYLVYRYAFSREIKWATQEMQG